MFAPAYVGRERRGDPDFLLEALARARCAAFIKESRMMFREANKLDRKSGEAPSKVCLFVFLLREPRPFRQLEFCFATLSLPSRPKRGVMERSFFGNVFLTQGQALRPTKVTRLSRQPGPLKSTSQQPPPSLQSRPSQREGFSDPNSPPASLLIRRESLPLLSIHLPVPPPDTPTEFP
jgi:hypothetical protein